MVCGNEDKGDCTISGITYELACKECKCKYVGEMTRVSVEFQNECDWCIPRRRYASADY